MDIAPTAAPLPFPPAPVAAWQSVATLSELPPALKWSGTQPIPAIGAQVHAYMNGFGAGEVRAYFHANGWLGVVVAVAVLPEWFAKQNPGITEGHFFGRELEPYGQADRQLPIAA
jgi:hypothetical protein